MLENDTRKQDCSKTDVQTLFELNKIGVNLNQLVRHINMLPVEEILFLHWMILILLSEN